MSDLWTLHPRWGELWDGGTRICRFNPDGTPGHGLYLTRDGVEGWDTLPDTKTDLTERGQGDGAHDIGAHDVTYSARTVTVHYEALGWDRADVVALMRRIGMMAHRLGRLRFVDGLEDTYIDGYVAQMGRTSKWNPRLENGLSFHFVAPRPERLSWTARRDELHPIADAGGGLNYGDAHRGIVFPMRFGRRHSDGRNRATLVNRGTSRAYPTFTLNGPFDSVTLDFAGSRLTYDEHVAPGVPVTLDSRSRTATVAGLDVSQHLTSRHFPTIPPGGSLPVLLTSAGGGWVVCETHDTYM